MEKNLEIIIFILWIAAGIWQASGWKEKKLSLAEKIFGFLSILIVIVLWDLIFN